MKCEWTYLEIVICRSLLVTRSYNKLLISLTTFWQHLCVFVISLYFSIPSKSVKRNKYKTIFGSHVEKKPASK